MLILGIGNDYRGDDAVGLHVVRILKSRTNGHIRVQENWGEGSACMEAWQGAHGVWVVDAMQSGAKPGTIVRWDAHTAPISPGTFRYSSHAFGLAEAIAMDKVLKRLPETFIVFGIEGKGFSAGERLSRPVAQAAQEVCRRIAQEIFLREEQPCMSPP